MEIYVGQFLVFLMLFVRSTSLLVVAPMLGHTAIPVQVKVALGLFVAFVMYPLASGTSAVTDATLIPLVLMTLKEALVGLIIGFAAGVLLAGVRYAGDLIAIDSGLSLATMFDPETNAHGSVISEALYLMMLTIFLLLDGHHVLLQALQLSYATVPLGTFAIDGEVAAQMVKIGGMVFVVAVKLAAPIIVAMFLTNVALSILSRVMPQMNLFSVVFPLKVAAGLLALVAALPLLAYVFKHLLASFEGNILELIKTM